MNLPDTAALLYQANSRLNKTSDTPALDAELLFCAIIGIDRSAVTTGRSMTLTNRQKRVFSTLIKRRTAGEPIAYLL